MKNNTIKPFASYVFLWISRELTWYEAEDMCQQMGMHQASISTSEEFQLVTGLLAGEGYTTEASVEQNILTPCRLVSPLCVVYIGLQVQVCFQLMEHLV